jgi:hypothetical protein
MLDVYPSCSVQHNVLTVKFGYLKVCDSGRFIIRILCWTYTPAAVSNIVSLQWSLLILMFVTVVVSLYEYYVGHIPQLQCPTYFSCTNQPCIEIFSRHLWVTYECRDFRMLQICELHCGQCTLCWDFSWRTNWAALCHLTLIQNVLVITATDRAAVTVHNEYFYISFLCARPAMF